MSQIANNDLEASLNQGILEGQALDAFEKYYADEIVMYEAGQPPTRKNCGRLLAIPGRTPKQAVQKEKR